MGCCESREGSSTAIVLRRLSNDYAEKTIQRVVEKILHILETEATPRGCKSWTVRYGVKPSSEIVLGTTEVIHEDTISLLLMEDLRNTVQKRLLQPSHTLGIKIYCTDDSCYWECSWSDLS